MTAKAALGLFLLEGKVLSLENCFKEIGISNPGREIPRMIEKPFGLDVSRDPVKGRNRHGNPVNFTRYRLNRSERNIQGIVKLKEYIKSEMEIDPPKTDVEAKNRKRLEQILMF